MCVGGWVCLAVCAACRVILWQFCSAFGGRGRARGRRKARRSAAHFAHPPGPLFKMGSVFASVAAAAVTLEEQAAVGERATRGGGGEEGEGGVVVAGCTL